MTQERRPVVVDTRPETSKRFAAALSEAGIAVEHVPLIAIAAPEDWRAVDESIDAHGSFDGILLTSANSVRFFFSRMRSRLGVIPDLPPLHAVGQRTADALRPFGLRCATVLAGGGGAELAVALGEVGGLRFLQPASDIAGDEVRDLLERSGAVVRKVVVYRTVASPEEHTARLRGLIASGCIRCVAFFSPSAVREFHRRVTTAVPAELRFAAIGETTAAALRGAGLRADIVAGRQTAEDLAERIAANVQSHQ